MAFTYYVSTSGSDLATGLTELLAFQHVDKAMNVVAAGDKVWVKGDGDYNETATIDAIGTKIAPIIFEGYSLTVGDGGQCTINGQSTRESCLLSSPSTGTDIFYLFKNFRFTGALSVGVQTSCDFLTFKDCTFDNCGISGFDGRNATFEKCSFFSINAGYGIGSTNGAVICIGCTFYNNQYGVYVASAGTVVIFGCIFFNNTDESIHLDIFDCAIINCTIDGNGVTDSVGIFLSTKIQNPCIINCIIYDCGVGIEQETSSRGERVVSRNNLVNSNTTDYINAITLIGEVTSAPQFTDEVDGADYTPSAGSPLINAGLNG